MARKQSRDPLDRLDTPRVKPGCCRHNHPIVGRGPCRACERQLDRDCVEFQRDVFFGIYNAKGYTEKEWIAAGRPRETWRAA
jgi:hypothetical protein